MSDERNARSMSEELVAACPPPFSLIAYFIAYLFGRPLAYLLSAHPRLRLNLQFSKQIIVSVEYLIRPRAHQPAQARLYYRPWAHQPQAQLPASGPPASGWSPITPLHGVM